MSFCTAINCMDGRFQLPVIRYLEERFGADHVDMITEPGPNRILAERSDKHAVASILGRLKISMDKHASVGIAVVGHEECTGNPQSRDEQVFHLQKAAEFLRGQAPKHEIIKLWVDAQGRVEELPGHD